MAHVIKDPAITEALDKYGYRDSTLGGQGFQNSCLDLLDDLEACKKFLALLGKEGGARTAQKVLYDDLGWDMPTKSGDEVNPNKEGQMATKKNVGIVDIIKKTCSRETGATVNELVEALAKEFPDRDPNKMKSTVRTQLGGRLASQGVEITKTKDEKRGLVYRIAA